MKKHFYLIIIFYAFVKAGHLYSQSITPEKIEQEFRISESMVPQSALLFIKDFKVKKNVKWIKEISEEGTSVEAKFKADGTRYSIEFTEEGTLEDMEILITFSSLNDDVKTSIKNILKAKFDFYKIEKVQAQYLESKERILQWRNSGKDERSLQPLYEIVVKSRNRSERSKRYEFLFDKKGTFLEKQKIATRSDNILRF